MDFQNQNDLQVEKILDKKVFNGKTLYLVKWKNYPIEEATWECNKLLANVKDKIREFKYSKRAVQQIPNIKLQEDFPEGQIRDTFKRKRGRPPRLSFNSYRSAAYQSTQKNSTFNQTQQNAIKRGRGRPRGSKNKRPRHVHFEQQSSATYDSQQSEKSRIMQKTITNEDSSINESGQNGNKKLKKLKKMILKTQNLQMKDEIQKEFDIVDSQDQVSQQQLNLSLGQKSKDNFTQSNGKAVNQKGQQKNQLIKNLSKQISINREESSEQGELQSQDTYFREKQHKNQKQTKNFGTLSSQQEFRRIFGKQNNLKQNSLNKQLDSFQKKYFNQNKQQEKVPQPPFEYLKPSKIPEKLAEQKRSQTLKEKKTNIKENVTKNFTQGQTLLISKIDNKQILSKNSAKNIQKITKIYHLQTIKLPLYNKIDEFINDEFEQFSYGQFSEQQLKKMSLTRRIVQILNNSTNFKRLQLNSKVDQIKFIDKSRIFYDILCKNIKNNPQKDNYEHIEQLRQTLLSNNPENQILELRNCFIDNEVQEILYLVQFNQGEIIKKMTASDLTLYLIIDMIKSSGISCSDQCLGLILNFNFYLKFLEKSLLPFGMKNQSQTKIQKIPVRNIKLEDKDINKKSQLQDLLIEALRNVKNQPNHNHFDSSRLNKPIKSIDSVYQNKRKSSIFSQNQLSKQLFPSTKNSEKTAKYEEGSMGQKF